MRTLPEPVWRKIVDDYLRRGEAPLSPAGWAALDAAVAGALAAHRTARRFLPVYRPGGPGLQAVPAAAPHLPGIRPGIAVPMVHWDFSLPGGGPPARPTPVGSVPELAAAATAAAAVALAEDHLIFNGHPGVGHRGLLPPPGARSHPLGDLPSAVARLAAGGAPLALVAALDVAPALPADAASCCRAGVYITPVLPPGGALLVACDPARVDLAVVQDAAIAYLGAGRYRVFELVALRLKDPATVCRLIPG